jgi:hypothetical protein
MLVSVWLRFQPWRWRRYVPLKHRFTFIWLHDVISHKTELLFVISVLKLTCNIYLRYATLTTCMTVKPRRKRYLERPRKRWHQNRNRSDGLIMNRAIFTLILNWNIPIYVIRDQKVTRLKEISYTGTYRWIYIMHSYTLYTAKYEKTQELFVRTDQSVLRRKNGRR